MAMLLLWHCWGVSSRWLHVNPTVNSPVESWSCSLMKKGCIQIRDHMAPNTKYHCFQLNFLCRFILVGTLSDCPNPIGWYLRISAGGLKGMFLSKGGSPLQAANCYSRVGPALPGVTWQSQQWWGHRRLEGVRHKLLQHFCLHRPGGRGSGWGSGL